MPGFKKSNPGCATKDCCGTNPPVVSTLCCDPIKIPLHLVATFSASTYLDAGLGSHTFPGFTTNFDYSATGFSGAGWYGCAPLPREYNNAGNTYYGDGFMVTAVCSSVSLTTYIAVYCFVMKCVTVGAAHVWVIELWIFICFFAAGGSNHSISSSAFSCPANIPAFDSSTSPPVTLVTAGTMTATLSTCSPMHFTFTCTGKSVNTVDVVPA